MILVTGAAGMVGSYLTEVFRPEELYLTDMNASHGIASLDVRDAGEVTRLVGLIRPDHVLHLAAETDVDRCERDPAHAFLSNATATGIVAEACVKYHADIIYISTCGVFDGAKTTPYTEFDEPTPVTEYGKAKLAGETLVREICKNWYIVRAGWMFGGGFKDKKFVGKVASQCAAGAPSLRCVTDKFGSPTYAKDLLRMVKQLTERRMYGLFHGVNQGCCSRYDVAVEIAAYLGTGTKIVPASSADFQLSASRPASEAVLSQNLDELGIRPMRIWKDALHEYLDSWIPSHERAISA
jgi:dTDP-4-dehydrorhamnose reductase